MRTLNTVTRLPVIIGGLNRQRVGPIRFGPVAALFGGQDAALSRIVHIPAGVSAIWRIGPRLRIIPGRNVSVRRDTTR